MGKNFRIPPPLLAPSAFGEKVAIDKSSLNEESLAELNASLIKVWKDVVTKFKPYVQRKLATIKEDVVGKLNPDTNEYRPPQEIADNLCQAMAFFYVGRRIGNLRTRIVEADIPPDDPSQTKDNTAMVISGFLTDLSKLVGQKQAAQMYRKMESITDDVLITHFGRAGP